MKLSRRDFIKLGALTAATAVLPTRAWALMDNGGDFNLDPRDPGGFSSPLFKPGFNGGLLGFFEPRGPFMINATQGSANILPGKESDLLIYQLADGAKGYINPILKVKKGQRLNPVLKNSLSQQATIIHWHGLIVDGKNDGGPADGISSGETYQYDFTVRNRAGTYWYHPHPFGFTSEQAYKGLASFFLVEDDDEIRLRRSLGLKLGENDIPLVIQDKRFDEMGNLMYEPDENEWFMGFLGDTILANLTVKPYLNVIPQVYRFRVLNGSNARIYRLAFLKGAEKAAYYIIGNDGGFLDKPYRTNEAFIAPGERMDILLDLRNFRPGDELFLKSLPFDPMDNEEMTEPMAEPMAAEPSMGLDNGEEFYILKLNVKKSTGCQPSHHQRIPGVLSCIVPTDMSDAMMREITLSQADMQWFINGQKFDFNQFPIEVSRNTVEIWDIMNDMMSMPHPMHIHGFQFQVLERMVMEGAMENPGMDLAVDEMGRLPTDLGWKDTVLIWPGEKVKIAIDFSHNFQGEQRYVFHCHNLEHEDMGMMVNYRVA
jgi:suppressor of ftsI/bilirubin oxidase